MLQTGLQKLKSAFTESALSKARIVVIEGPAGFGKSELLEALATHATEEQAIVLRAAALRSESSLPLTVMRQLVDAPALPAEQGARLRALVDDDQAAAGPGSADWLTSARTARMQKVCAAVQDLLADRLVVIGVDDLQYVDAASLQYLLYIAGRCRSSRLLMVFTETLYYQQRDPAYRTEFLRQPNFQRIRLGSLGRQDIARLLAADGHSHPDEATIDEYLAVTGGNPLLLRALQEERAMIPAPRHPDGPRPVTSEAFALAVLTCVDRSGPMAAKVAEGLAILGHMSTLDRLSRLCDTTRMAAAQGLRALQAAAVIEDDRFRHPATGAGVLEGMAPDHRRRLHRRAAALLRADGAPAAEIAPHVRAADGVDEPWGVTVLQDAAEEVLADDQDRLATDYLELAHRFCAEPQRRTEIRLRNAVILRRSNPAAAERIAEELLDDLRAGALPRQHHLALADLFVGHRRMTEVSEILTALQEETADSGPLALSRSDTLLTVVSDPYAPPPVAHGAGAPPLAERSPAGPLRPLAQFEYRKALQPWSSLAEGDHDRIFAAAEELLRRSVLTDATLEPILSAIKCLQFAGKIDKARHWSDLLLDESLRRNTGGWHAMFSVLRSDVALQQGNLPEVVSIVRSGLNRIPDRQGSVLAAGLLAMQVLAQTAMGNYEAVATALNRPAPESLFGSIHGIVYLRARGHYNLVTNRPYSALDDFLAVGRMTENWGIDRPWWVPWRGDAAETWLQLGNREEAQRLASEQLAMTGSGNARVRGISLRLLGEAADSGRRLTLLTRAVRQLQIAGDRLELARALYELSEIQRKLGHTSEAAGSSRRAWQLARECRAEPLCARMRQEHNEAVWEVPTETVAVDGHGAKLSESEKKVAVLAACGYSNRDISSRLYITVSTVEQHLTRVYRKLNIGGRQQLPVDLQFEVSEIA
ncbi:helix-turn-helix transcriptional regulator [Streptomyces litchfieldiae]|uniref:AAA family ATPase n=1 Tax=Streptomyces litchfieldiae TaxID=3075543 RepID=A0ABU2MS76_9ACTN|nr:AAA family ATPase [Streptomyces sp. DSM 44938]MDT0343464.1 AAA family ATPase [Streptomyces sp. DSM 44938]